jgi:mRNA interferase MazF
MSLIKPNRGEVWFVELDPIVAHEQAKKRPCVIISANKFNHGKSGLVVIVPLTSKNKANPLHVPIASPEGGVLTKSYALCDQLRTVSINRLSNSPLGVVKNSTLKLIEYMVKVILDFD